MGTHYNRIFFPSQGVEILHALVALGGIDRQEILGIQRHHYLPGNGGHRYDWLVGVVTSLKTTIGSHQWNRSRHIAIDNLRELWTRMEHTVTSDDTFDCVLWYFGINPRTHTWMIELQGHPPSNLSVVDYMDTPLYTRSVGLQLAHEIESHQSGSSGRGVDIFAVAPHYRAADWYHQHAQQTRTSVIGPVNVEAITESDVIPVCLDKRKYGLRRVVVVDLLDVPLEQLELEAAKVIYHTQHSIVTVLLSPMPLTAIEFNYHPFGL